MEQKLRNKLLNVYGYLYGCNSGYLSDGKEPPKELSVVLKDLEEILEL